MKKSIYLLLIILLLTSCKVEYHLDVDKSLELVENIRLISTNEIDTEKIATFNQYTPINIEIDDISAYKEKKKDIEYYDFKKGKDNTQIEFNYNYNIDKFNNNIFANNCYEYVTTTQKDNILILSTSKEFLCFDKYDNLEEVTVIIKSKYKLKETNADEKKKHEYIWNITKSNQNNKYLYLSLDTTKEDLTFLEKLKEGAYLNIFTLSVILFIIGVIIYSFLKKKGQKRDEI